MQKIKQLIKRIIDKLTDENRICRINPAGLLICYVIILLWVIVFKCNANNELHIDKNLAMSVWERFTYRIIPFQDAYISFTTRNFVSCIAFVFNTICCIPGGILLAFFMSKKRGLFCSTLFILGVELFQLFSGWGGFDPTDILMNVLGIYLGYVVFEKSYPKLKPRLINILSLSILIPSAIFSIFVIIRSIIYFPV